MYKLQNEMKTNGKTLLKSMLICMWNNFKQAYKSAWRSQSMKFNSFLVQNTFTFYHSINHKWKLLKDSKQPQIITKTNEFVLGVFFLRLLLLFFLVLHFSFILFSHEIFFSNKFFQLKFLNLSAFTCEMNSQKSMYYIESTEMQSLC